MKAARKVKSHVISRQAHSKAQKSFLSLPTQIDLPLLFLVTGMVVFGLIMVYSASFIYAQERTGDGFAFIKKQSIVAVLGFAGLWLACQMDYQKIRDRAFLILGLATLLLALVWIPGFGVRVGGAQRWLQFPGFNLQPGEIAKFAVIAFVARQLTVKREELNRWVPAMIAPILLAIPAMGLLLMQPDFGTTVMISATVFAMLFLAGVPTRFLASVLAVGGATGAYLALGTAYRRARIETFLDPWADPLGKGFQIIQSWIGLHHGQVMGVGLGNGKEKLFYLPEAHNDFIFAVIGEELGFLGVLGVAAAFLFFIYRGLKIAYDAEVIHQDRFGMLLASGITLALGLQGFVNMAIVLGLLPTKGLTLPMISYGGSALLVDLIAVGVLLSIGRGPQSRFSR